MLKYIFSIWCLMFTGLATAQTFSLSGQVLTDTQQPAGGVLLEVLDQSDQVIASFTTDCSGGFSFTNLLGGTDYTLRVEKEGSSLNGNSTFDLVLISKYLLGADDLANTYRETAADVDESGSVSVLDLLLMRALILAIQEAYPGDNWLFFRPGDLVANIEFDFSLTTDLENFDLITIKKGDVNASAIPCE